MFMLIAARCCVTWVLHVPRDGHRDPGLRPGKRATSTRGVRAGIKARCLDGPRPDVEVSGNLGCELRGSGGDGSAGIRDAEDAAEM